LIWKVGSILRSGTGTPVFGLGRLQLTEVLILLTIPPPCSHSPVNTRRFPIQRPFNNTGIDSQRRKIVLELRFEILKVKELFGSRHFRRSLYQAIRQFNHGPKVKCRVCCFRTAASAEINLRRQRELRRNLLACVLILHGLQEPPTDSRIDPVGLRQRPFAPFVDLVNRRGTVA
jgi:hypothetical protein